MAVAEIFCWTRRWNIWDLAFLPELQIAAFQCGNPADEVIHEEVNLSIHPRSYVHIKPEPVAA